MNEEEFITKFYSCDDEEQFLKDVYHNLNCLQQESQQLKIQISSREEVANNYEEVIEEIRKKLKLERKTALSLKQTYTVSVIDSVLQILDKGESNE